MSNAASSARLTRMGRQGRCVLLLLLIVPGLVIAAPPALTVVRARYLMGTIFRIEAPATKDSSATAAALEEALEEVGRLEDVLSNWRSDSELSRLNARAGTGATEVSPALFAAVRSSLIWARETGGAFDPTVEPLTRRMRSGTAQSPPVPQAPSLPGSPRAGGWMQISLDAARRTVLIPAGGGLDMGGIGKGMALEAAARVLAQRGIHDALLDAGGQLLALGSPPGEMGWSVAVADPADRERPTYPFILNDVSLATSGNSQRPGEIVNPATGQPVAGRFSATAVALDATSADALSTALFVMGPQRGESWARRRSDVLALFLEPGESAKDPPRATGTLGPAPPGHFLLITRRQHGDSRSLHVEVR